MLLGALSHLYSESLDPPSAEYLKPEPSANTQDLLTAEAGQELSRAYTPEPRLLDISGLPRDLFCLCQALDLFQG